MNKITADNHLIEGQSFLVNGSLHPHRFHFLKDHPIGQVEVKKISGGKGTEWKKSSQGNSPRCITPAG